MPSLNAIQDSETELTPVVPTSARLSPGSILPEAFDALAALERYKLVARLGHGGMAEVFLAALEVAPFVHRPVVIKRLHAQFKEDPQLMQMFLDEARLVCQLQHENIVKTLEVGAIDGRCCIAMEYLEGQPLHRLVRRAYQRGALPIDFAVRIGCAVLEALHYAHEARDAQARPLGIVHRDVSPHNIFVCNDGSVKVLDFGIAKAATQEGRTATGIVKGKVGYIAPEQAAAEHVDRRADVWSVGVVLWEALTGARLFRAETDAATLNLTLTGDIASARTFRSDLPAELDAILARALQRNPSQRYASAADMLEQLQNWLSARGPAAREPQALGAAMRDLFASEIVEQRRMVSVLMARSDCTPPSVMPEQPSSTSAVVVSSASTGPLSVAQLSSVHSRVDELTRRHRVAVRSMLGAILLLLGLAGGLLYVGLTRGRLLEAPLASAPPPAVAARVSAPIAAAAVQAAPLDEGAPNGAGAKDAASKAVLARAAAVTPKWHAGAPAARNVAALAPSPAAAPANPEPSARDAAGPGFLTIDTTPWSIVSVGGKMLGQTPLVGVKLPPGAQTLSLRNPELGIETQYGVTIESGKTIVRRIGIE